MSRILGPETSRRRAWKNGLGSTLDVASDAERPEQEWTWRLSIADVPEAARFSEFPGVDRLLLCLEGPGLSVECSGARISVPSAGEALAFAGEEEVRGEPLGPGVRDVNLMLRRDRWRGRMTLLRGGSRSLEGEVLIIHAAAFSPAFRVDTQGGAFELGPGSTLVARGRAAVRLEPGAAAVLCALDSKT